MYFHTQVNSTQKELKILW